MLLAQFWRSFQNCAIFDCECGAVLDDLRHDDRRGGEKLMNCQRSDVLVLRMLVRPVKMNPGPALDRPLPADSVEKVASAAANRSGVPAAEVAASHFKLPFGVSLSVPAQV